MARVWVRPARGNGRERRLNASKAQRLVDMGLYVYVDKEPAPSESPAAGYAALAYNDLRAEVARRDLVPSGRKKDDLIAALEAADVAPPAEPATEADSEPEPEDEPGEEDGERDATYSRRDLRAE